MINPSLSSYFPGLRIVDTCGNIQFTSSRILSLAAEYNLINFIANKNDVGNNTVASKSQNLPQNFDGKIITLFCGYSIVPDYSRDFSNSNNILWSLPRNRFKSRNPTYLYCFLKKEDI